MTVWTGGSQDHNMQGIAVRGASHQKAREIFWNTGLSQMQYFSWKIGKKEACPYIELWLYVKQTWQEC